MGTQVQRSRVYAIPWRFRRVISPVLMFLMCGLAPRTTLYPPSASFVALIKGLRTGATCSVMARLCPSRVATVALLWPPLGMASEVAYWSRMRYPTRKQGCLLEPKMATGAKQISVA